MRLLQAEEIEGLLLKVPPLVDLLDGGDPAFVDAVISWLRDLETALLANQAPIASQISTLRGSLITIARGQAPPGVEFTRSASKRKLREAGAMDALRAAESTVSQHLSPTRQTIGEAGHLVGQLLVAAEQKNIPDPGTWDASGPGLLNLWSAIASDSELRPATARVLALVGQADALILLSRSMVG